MKVGQSNFLEGVKREIAFAGLPFELRVEKIDAAIAYGCRTLRGHLLHALKVARAVAPEGRAHI